MNRILLAEKVEQEAQATNPTQLEIEDHAAEMSKKYNVPLELILRHMWIESTYVHIKSDGTLNTSSKGAMGLMQLMPAAARTVGVDREDWRQNIEGGTKYLSRMHKKYTGKTAFPWVVASMAYYTGPGNIDKTVKSAKENNMEILDYVVMMKNKKSQYHMSIFGYAKSIYDDGHRRNANRPKIETNKGSLGMPGVEIPKILGGTVTAKAIEKPKDDSTEKANVEKPTAAEPEKKQPVQSAENTLDLSVAQRPDLRIYKDSKNKYFISYEGTDPLNQNILFKGRDLDKELKRLLGYSSWSAYKTDNRSDLFIKRKKDLAGNVEQAPTIHGIHIAYALEEFTTNIKNSDYSLIAIPKGSNTKQTNQIRQSSKLRNDFFKSNGFLETAMKNPPEGLRNKAVVNRALKNANLDKIESVLQSQEMFVQDSAGRYWPKFTEDEIDYEKFTKQADDNTWRSTPKELLKDQFGSTPTKLNEAMVPSKLHESVVKGVTTFLNLFSTKLATSFKAGVTKLQPEKLVKDVIEIIEKNKKNVPDFLSDTKDIIFRSIDDIFKNKGFSDESAKVFKESIKKGDKKKSSEALAKQLKNEGVENAEQKAKNIADEAFDKAIKEKGIQEKFKKLIEVDLKNPSAPVAVSKLALQTVFVGYGIEKGTAKLKGEKASMSIEDLFEYAKEQILDKQGDLDGPKLIEFFTEMMFFAGSLKIIGASGDVAKAGLKALNPIELIKIAFKPAQQLKQFAKLLSSATVKTTTGALLALPQATELIVTGGDNQQKEKYYYDLNLLFRTFYRDGVEGVIKFIKENEFFDIDEDDEEAIRNITGVPPGPTEKTHDGVPTKNIEKQKLEYYLLPKNWQSSFLTRQEIILLYRVGVRQKVPLPTTKPSPTTKLPAPAAVSFTKDLDTQQASLGTKTQPAVAGAAMMSSATVSSGALIPPDQLPEIKQEEIELGKKIGLELFSGAGNVRPVSTQRSFAQKTTIEFLNNLAATGDKWTVGDITNASAQLIKGVHRSHQTGLDVDLAIPYKNGTNTIFDKFNDKEKFKNKGRKLARIKKRGWDYEKVRDLKQIDLESTIRMLKVAYSSGAIFIIVDRAIINSIKNYARQNNLISEAVDKELVGAIDLLMKGKGSTHLDHFHIRFPLFRDHCPNGKGGKTCNRLYLDNWITFKKLSKYLKKKNIDIESGVSADTSTGMSMQKTVNRDVSQEKPEVKYGYRDGAEPEYGYILSSLDGRKVYAKYNEQIGENRTDFQGASMNKPIIALIHRMKYPKGTKKALTDAEIKGLLTYTSGATKDSNYVNALISGGTSGKVHSSPAGKIQNNIRAELAKKLKKLRENPKLNDKQKTAEEIKLKKEAKRRINVQNRIKQKLSNRLRTIGTLTVKDTQFHLEKLGLDKNMQVRFSNNRQSPIQYHNFMKLIHDEEKINGLGIKEAVDEILNYMKRSENFNLAVGRDRESKRWSTYKKALNDAGIRVKKIYGKGGKVFSTFHYSLVVDDKYLLTIFSSRLDPTNKKKRVHLSKRKRDKDRFEEHHDWFTQKIVSIFSKALKGKINENLLAHKPFLKGGLR